MLPKLTHIFSVEAFLPGYMYSHVSTTISPKNLFAVINTGETAAIYVLQAESGPTQDLLPNEFDYKLPPGDFLGSNCYLRNLMQ